MDQLISDLKSDGGVCRTAPATPGLLMTRKRRLLIVLDSFDERGGHLCIEKRSAC